MKRFNHPVRQALDLAQRRFVRSRPGSVLILVVALLVLMALIGTAYMTMAQFDRISAVQHTFNTEVDLLVEGVINQVKGVVAGDLFISGQFRPAVNNAVVAPALPAIYNSSQTASYNYFNGVGYDLSTPPVTAGATPGDWWLSTRLPVLPNEAAAPSQVANAPGWSFLTGAINRSGVFNDPTSTITYSVRSGVYPCVFGGSPFIPTRTTIDNQFWPALYDPKTNTSFMAADTDGDGIADAGFMKLLTLEGVTYYAAVRIVDNAAAINASIALRPNPIATYTTATPTGMPGDFSPVNLDLEGMLVKPVGTPPATPPVDLYGPLSLNGPGLLANFRFNNFTTPGSIPIGDLPLGTGTPRNDFLFLQYPDPLTGYNYFFDEQWSQLGRRLRYPGFIAAKTHFQALGVSENMAMAAGFVLRDPRVIAATASSSVLEQRMPNTFFTPAKTAAYAPDNAIAWFTDNFNFLNDYTSGTNTMPMRALTVGLNPVSNFAPGKFHDLGTTAPTSFAFGDMITFNNHRYVCINPGTVTAPREPSNLEPNWQDPNWAFEPWKTAPTKTSANAGTFQQLYAAYWAVMADQYVPAVGATPAQWNPAFTKTATTEARMFRSPLRSDYTPAGPPPVGTGFSSQQTMYLRAALAAVNTMDLRDADNDVTSRTIYIPNALGTPQYQVNVYGAERQPYLTQIYARNDATAANDFMAVEFYNPYNVAIDISGWKLAIVDRTTPGNLKVASLDGSPLGKTLQTEVTTPSALTSIPAKSFIVLLSNTATPPATVLLPAVLPTNFYQCTDLTKAFGQELVLMRPRLASGTPKAGTLFNNVFDETAPPMVPPTSAASFTGLYDWIPVDSYDFTKIAATAPNATPQEWEYRRPDDPTMNKNWHFVYPGPWQVPAGGPPTNPPPTWTATVVTLAPLAQTDLTILKLGTANASVLAGPGAAKYQDVTIQVNNTDFGGPLKPTIAGPNYQPLGSFVRNGDLLQVTFIGGYKILDISAPTAPKLVELNSLTADSAMATAQDLSGTYLPIATAAITAENIGRFCPIDPGDATVAGPTGGPVDDYGATVGNWRYQWATRLFDFLTVQQPGDDYLPDVDPWQADQNYGPSTPYYRYPPANPGVTANIPQAVSNVSGAANTGLDPKNLTTFVPATASEETAPVDGLVNINTAQWRVLAAVPWVPATTAGYRATNAAIAQAIVKYRDLDDGSGTHPHGPFKSLFELNSVVYGGGKLRDILGPANASDFTSAQGNLSPLDQSAGTDQVAGDFESLFNMMTRVSNLVTTRSDSYTAYILIQGWTNAETTNAHLVVQRRAAIIIDRSTVTRNNPSPSAVSVPVD